MLHREEIAKELLNDIEQTSCKKLFNFLNSWTKGLYVILRVIEKTSDEVTAGMISNILGVSTARTAVALKTLEIKKWIKKQKSTLDARKTIVSLTDLGKEKIQEKEQELVCIVECFLNRLTDEEVQQLINIIKKTL